MQLDQIILRPTADLILLQHTDSAGRSGSTVIPPPSLDAKQAEALASFLALCRDRLPPEPDHPARAELEQEIAELEYRLGPLGEALQPAGAGEGGGRAPR